MSVLTNKLRPFLLDCSQSESLCRLRSISFSRNKVFLKLHWFYGQMMYWFKFFKIKIESFISLNALSYDWIPQNSYHWHAFKTVLKTNHELKGISYRSQIQSVYLSMVQIHEANLEENVKEWEIEGYFSHCYISMKVLVRKIWRTILRPKNPKCIFLLVDIRWAIRGAVLKKHVKVK